MTAAEVVPTDRVRPQPPAWLKLRGLDRCGHCKGGHHRSCHGAVRVPPNRRVPDGLIRCYCQQCEPQVRCLDCGNQFGEDVSPKNWKCWNVLSCFDRIRLRQSNDRLWRMIQDCKTEAARKRRDDRARQELIRTQVGPESEDRVANRTPRPTIGACECCGGETKGGSFLPGHDAKYKSKLRKASDAGDKDAYRQLVERGWA